MYYLENKKNGHKKFYEVSIYVFIDNKTNKDDNIYVALKWGRIGTWGRTQYKEFKSRAEAITFVHEKLRKKLNNGYNFI